MSKKLIAALSLSLVAVSLLAAAAKPQTARHRVAIQVDDSNPATMTLALNNAENVIEYFASKNETVDVAVVTYGPGLHMLRADTSPVKDRIAQMSLQHANLHFDACEITREKMAAAEKKPVPIIPEGQSVPSGVVTLMELQAQGYAYIRP